MKQEKRDKNKQKNKQTASTKQCLFVKQAGLCEQQDDKHRHIHIEM